MFLKQAKNYNTFLSLIKSTGVDALLLKHDTPPGVTIFAPDDSAFAKLPKGSYFFLSLSLSLSLSFSPYSSLFIHDNAFFLSSFP